MKIVFFLIIIPLIILSFVLSKKLKDGSADFLVPRDGIPFVVIALTMAASQFGSSMLIGGVQQAQQQSIGQGFWPAIYTLLAASASCFLNILIAPRFKKFGDSVTPPDFIQVRYGRSKFMRLYHTIVFMCSVTAILVSQFVGFASMGVAVGFSYKFSIVLCGAVILLLALGSGMMGVAWTDAIQYILITVLLLVSTVFSLRVLNSEGISFAEAISEPFFPTEALKGKFFYTAFPMLIGNMFSYDYFMRFMSCKGMKEARKASALAGVALLLTAIPIALLGVIANRLYQGADSASVFGLIINNDMPPVMSALLMMVVLMALMTSADSMLTSVSGMISKDIYAEVVHKGKPISQIKNFNKVVKISMVAVAVIAAVFALYFDEILKITFFFSPLTSGTMFAPMIIGLFWKGASRKGAIMSIIFGAASGLLHLTGVITLFDRVAGPALVGTIAIIVFSLLLPDKKTLKGDA